MFIRNRAMVIAGVLGMAFSSISGLYMMFKTGQVGSALVFQLPYSIFCAVFFWLSFKVGVSSGVRIERRGFSVQNLFTTVDVGYDWISEVRLNGRLFLKTKKGEVEMFSFSPSLYGDLTGNKSYIPIRGVLQSALERGRSAPLGGMNCYRTKIKLDLPILLASFVFFFLASLILDVG